MKVVDGKCACSDLPVTKSIHLKNCVYIKQEESEVPDDETINQMIARTEEEFELFQVGARISCYLQLVLRRIHTYCRELRSFNTPYLLKCINLFFSSITTPSVRFNFW